MKTNNNFINLRRYLPYIFLLLLLLIEGAMVMRSPLSPFYLLFLFFALYLVFFQFKYAILLLLVVMTNVFGFFSDMGLPPVRTPFGTFHLKDVAFLMLIFPLIIDVFNENVSRSKNILSLPIVLLLLLTLMQILRAYFLMHEDIHYIMRVARPFTYYTLFFAFVYKINDEKLFDFIIKVVIFVGFVSAIVGIAQVIFGVSLAGSKIEMTEYGYARTYQPNLLFTLFGFFILLSKDPGASYDKFRFSLPIYYIITVIFVVLTFSRGLWYIFGLSLVIFYLFGTDRTRIFKHAFISCIILGVVFLIGPNFSKHLSHALLDRAQSGLPDITHQEGTFGKRMEILGYSWDYAKKDNPLLGVGFKYGKIRGYTPKESSSITIKKDAYRWLGTDAGSAYILFRHGIIAILIFMILYYKLFTKGVRFYLKTQDPYYKGLMKIILIINIIALLLAIISEPFTSPEMLIVLLISWFMFEYVQKQA